MKIPLFDFCGTIFSGGDNSHYPGYDYAFKNFYKKDASYKEISISGMTDKQIFIEILGRHGISRQEVLDTFDKAKELTVEYFEKHSTPEEYTPLPGVRELLTALKEKGIPIGALTGNIEEIGWKKLELVGIRDYFDFGAFGDATDKRFELVEIARERAQEKLNRQISSEDLVIVGDTPKDIEGARKGKAFVIAVSTGSYNFAELAKYSPDLLVHSLEEKDKIIDFLTK